MMFDRFILILWLFLVSEVSPVAAVTRYHYDQALSISYQTVSPSDAEYYFGTLLSTYDYENDGVVSILGSPTSTAGLTASDSFMNPGTFSLAGFNNPSYFEFSGDIFENTGKLYLQTMGYDFQISTTNFYNGGTMEIITDNRKMILTYTSAFATFQNTGTLILNNTQMAQPNLLGNGCIILCNNAGYTVGTISGYNQTHRLLDSTSGLYFDDTKSTGSVNLQGFTLGNNLYFSIGTTVQVRQKRKVSYKNTYSYDPSQGVLTVNVSLGGAYLIQIGLGYDNTILGAVQGSYFVVTTLRTDYNAVDGMCQLTDLQAITALPVASSTTKYMGASTITTTITGVSTFNTVLEMDPMSTVTTSSYWSETYTETFTNVGADTVTLIVNVPSPEAASAVASPSMALAGGGFISLPTDAVTAGMSTTGASTAEANTISAITATTQSLSFGQYNSTSATTNNSSKLMGSSMNVALTDSDSISSTSEVPTTDSDTPTTMALVSSVTNSSASVSSGPIVSGSVILSSISTGMIASASGSSNTVINTKPTQRPGVAFSTSMESASITSLNSFSTGFFNLSLTQGTATAGVNGSEQTFSPALLEDSGNINVITQISTTDEVTQSKFAFKGDVFSFVIKLDYVSEIPANSYARFVLPGPFTGYNSSFNLLDQDGDVLGKVTADTATNIFTIKFDNEWVADHSELHGDFVIYGYMSYTSGGVSKRDGKSIDLSRPTSVIFVPNAGPGKIYPIEFEYSDVNTVHSAVLPQVSTSLVGTPLEESVLTSSGLQPSTLGSATPNPISFSTPPSSYYGSSSKSSNTLQRSSDSTGLSRSSRSSRFARSSASSSSSSLAVSVRTTTAQSATTTLITITDCGTETCSRVVPVVTNYVTYCPLGTVVTITSCSISGCSPYAVSLAAGSTTITGCFAAATPAAGSNGGNNGNNAPGAAVAPPVYTLTSAPQPGNGPAATSGAASGSAPKVVSAVANLALKSAGSLSLLLASFLLLC